MSILNKHKKMGKKGFFDFVYNLEVYDEDQKKNITQISLLEDPVYVKWALINQIDIHFFMKDLTTNEKELVIQAIPNPWESVLYAFYSTDYEDALMVTLSEKSSKKYIEAREYFKTPAAEAQRKGQNLILRTVRKLQAENAITPFKWKLPEEDVLNGKKSLLPVRGEFKQYYEDGKIALEGQVEDKMREGHWFHYYPNGQILAEGIYIQGKKEGKWHFYYSDGKTMTSGEFQNDQRNGSWKEMGKTGIEKTIKYAKGKVSE